MGRGGGRRRWGYVNWITHGFPCEAWKTLKTSLRKQSRSFFCPGLYLLTDDRVADTDLDQRFCSFVDMLHRLLAHKGIRPRRKATGVKRVYPQWHVQQLTVMLLGSKLWNTEIAIVKAVLGEVGVGVGGNLFYLLHLPSRGGVTADVKTKVSSVESPATKCSLFSAWSKAGNIHSLALPGAISSSSSFPFIYFFWFIQLHFSIFFFFEKLSEPKHEQRIRLLLVMQGRLFPRRWWLWGEVRRIIPLLRFSVFF